MAAAAADEAPTWAAVGLLGEPGGGGCSAVLIEPDLVLTAAHCVAGAPAAAQVFRPSTEAGLPGPPLPGRQVTLHPAWIGHVAVSTDIDAIIVRDIALFRLDAPVDISVARPIPAGPFPNAADPLTLVSFRGGKPPLMVRECPQHRRSGLVFEVECAVRSGESGAPVIARTAGGPVTVGIVSRRDNDDGTELALGTALADNLAVLRAAEALLNAD